jgi:hypothetical protein
MTDKQKKREAAKKRGRRDFWAGVSAGKNPMRSRTHRAAWKEGWVAEETSWAWIETERQKRGAGDARLG